MAVARAEEGDVGSFGGDSSSGKVLELEEKVALLTSENEVMVDECRVLREEVARLQGQHTSSSQQLLELREQNAMLRKRAATQEVEDSQGAASVKIALAEAERKSSQSDHLRMELDAAEREVKVLAHELQAARHDLHTQAQSSAEYRKRAEEQERQHETARGQLERELAAAKDVQQNSVGNAVRMKHEMADLRARAESHEREAARLKRQLEESERQMRTLEQQLVEARGRCDTLKDQMRRFEEEKDELQLAADQATALKEQAQREIARLSDRLQQVLVEAQARSEETVSSIRAKYQAQKARLHQQIAELEVEVAALQSDKERLVRECRSAEAEVDKLAREGPGGNLGRLQREIDTLSQNCKDMAVERDQAVHGAKASELAVRRKEAQWEQSQLQSAAQIETLQRRIRAADLEASETKDETFKLRAEMEAAARRVKELEGQQQTREVAAQGRVQELTSKCKAELDEMLQRVQRAEASEAASKSELSELLGAHDKLQDKWREASRNMASQSQRHITDLREQVGRLEERNRELNDKLAHALAANASSTARTLQQERAMERLRMLLDAAEKRAEETKAQVSQLMRTEADLLQQRKQDTFRLERQQLELERVSATLQDNKKALEALQKKDDFALSTQGELEAALRETKVKTVRLKQRLAAMGSNTEGSGDKVLVRDI
eukprot:Tamp_07750.p1 GENE.Tamp_07750~~Tamp_07750.p1  ORF type:complete len:743 (+),score=282.72 Tamp_07750:215-2230(+)